MIKTVMGDRLSLAVQHEHPRTTPLRKRVLSDQLRWEFIIKVGGSHRQRGGHTFGGYG